MKKVLIILLILSIAITVYAIIPTSRARYVRPMHPQVNTVGLIAHYKMWDGLMTTGEIFDYTCNGNNGTLFDTDTPLTLIPKYPGFYFDGANDYIDTGDTFHTMFQDSFSICMWFKATDGQPGATVYLWGVDNGDALNTTYLALTTAGSFLFKYETDGEASNVGTGVLLADGQSDWHHILITADSTINGAGGLKIYFDGQLAETAGFHGDTTDAVFADHVGTEDVYIGAEDAGGVANGLWYGLIDNVMFSNVAETEIEARNIYEVTRWRYQK